MIFLGKEKTDFNDVRITYVILNKDHVEKTITYQNKQTRNNSLLLSFDEFSKDILVLIDGNKFDLVQA
jgi:hypothetical protein